MSSQQDPATDEDAPQAVAGATEDGRIFVVTKNAMAVEGPPADQVETEDDSPRSVTEMVEQPAKVMRIGRMVQQLLEEVKSAPLDEPGRKRLTTVLHASIQELKDGLAPELDAELDRLIQPFDETTPTESELRIAQAQLVGWLEGLFHGIQTAIYAQQMAARSQLEQMRRALPPGAMPGLHGQQGADDDGNEPGAQGGMYL
jgi:hypothetical protein